FHRVQRVIICVDSCLVPYCYPGNEMAMDRAAVVDLGGTWVRAALVGEDGKLLGRVAERTDHSKGPAGVIDQIVGCVRLAVGKAELPVQYLSQAVVSAPGPINSRTGIAYGPPNMLGWTTVPVKEMVEARLAVPVQVINDANVAALGELRFGAGKGARDLVYITISTGIGAGVVIGGKILEGVTGMAGELGHATIDRGGPVCKCGNVGCLETIASGTSIVRRYLEAVPSSTVSSVPGVVEAATGGDEIAESIMDDAMEAIGVGVVNAIQIFNPEAVILGGGVTKLGERLFGTVQRVVAERAFPVSRSAVRILPAALGDDVGLMGGAAIILDQGVVPL
ncbi:MAG: ROK family protein, partial [Chloroflexota bacterium]